MESAVAAGDGGAPMPRGDHEEMLREVWPWLVRLGRLLTGSTELGEDLAQEAIAGFLKRRDVGAPAAYLRRSVVNGAINASRRASRERRHLAATSHELQLVPAPEIDELWPLVLALPARQRAVLVLRYYDDLTEAEIARVLGCPPGTVKSLAARALTALRKEMSS